VYPYRGCKAWKNLLWSSCRFQPISKSSHSTYMLCTALPPLTASMHQTTLAFPLIPAMTCSYKLFRRFDWTRALEHWASFWRLHSSQLQTLLVYVKLQNIHSLSAFSVQHVKLALLVAWSTKILFYQNFPLTVWCHNYTSQPTNSLSFHGNHLEDV